MWQMNPTGTVMIYLVLHKRELLKIALRHIRSSMLSDTRDFQVLGHTLSLWDQGMRKKNST